MRLGELPKVTANGLELSGAWSTVVVISWHYYNEHRPHTACTNQPPFSRLINVPGQYI